MENDNEALEKHNGIWRAVEAKRSPISKCQFNSNRKGMARSSVHYNFKWLNFSKYHYEVLIYKCQKAKSIYIHGERERPKQNKKKITKKQRNSNNLLRHFCMSERHHHQWMCLRASVLRFFFPLYLSRAATQQFNKETP